ncbi:MAG: hypothetical protein ABIK15_16835 [Pseudomonadota bacterium]
MKTATWMLCLKPTARICSEQLKVVRTTQAEVGLGVEWPVCVSRTLSEICPRQSY